MNHFRITSVLTTLVVAGVALSPVAALAGPAATISFAGEAYSSVYIASNTYLTFGDGSDEYWDLAADVPPLPGVQLCAGDHSWQYVLYRAEANNSFRVRYEGTDETSGDFGDPNIIFEAVFYKGKNYFDVFVGTHQGCSDTPRSSLVTDGSVLIGSFPGDDAGPNSSWRITTTAGSATISPISASFAGPSDGTLTNASGWTVVVNSEEGIYHSSEQDEDDDYAEIPFGFSSPTRSRSSGMYLSAAQRAQIAAQLGWGPAPAPTPVPSFVPAHPHVPPYVCVPSMSRGMRGESIRGLQTFLKSLGFFPAEADTTGLFGPMTESAVKAFQTSRGISPVGIVGPLTCAALNGMNR